MKRAIALLACATTTTACAAPAAPPHFPDGTIFEGTTDPIQYRGHAIRDLKVPRAPAETYGQACKTSIYLPTQESSPFLGSAYLANAVNPFALAVAAGDAGLVRAIADARAKARGREIYDVRVDVHSTSVLGVFHYDCVEVHAAVLP